MAIITINTRDQNACVFYSLSGEEAKCIKDDHVSVRVAELDVTSLWKLSACAHPQYTCSDRLN